MITTQKLSKDYNGKKVFENLNLQLNKGEILEIKGNSGEGKTTLKRCIAGLEEYNGQIDIDGDISFVFQEKRVLPWLNVMNNILAPLKLGNHEIDDKKVEEIKEIAEKFEVDEHLQKDINEVSGGELQRLMVLRGLITEPEILLLDEPFNSVDEKTRSDIYEKFLKICREKELSVLIASHNQDLENLVDRRVSLKSN